MTRTRSPWPRVLVAVLVVAGGVAWLVARRSPRSRPVAESAGEPAETEQRPRPARRPPVFRPVPPPAPASPAPSGVPSWFAQPDLPAREIAGMVLREHRPAGQVQVLLESQASAARPALRRQVNSRPDGTFTFGPQPPGPYELIAQVAGSEPVQIEIDLRSPRATPPPDRVLVVLEPCRATVSGLVTDQTTGTPVTGARVVSLPARSPAPLVGPATRTGSSGDYELCVAPGDARLRVEASGYATALLTAPGDERHDFQLLAEAILIGTATDRESGAALAGVQVNAWPLSGPPAAAPSAALSDATGRFELRGLYPGARYKIDAWRTDFISDDALSIDVGPGTTSGVVRHLAPASRVQGVVMRQGRPVPGARVRLDRPPYASSLTSISQADGRFTLHGVPRGSDTPVVEGFRVLGPSRVEVPAAGVRELVVEVEPLRR